MAQFILCPAGSHGDVHPILAVGQGLAAHGHIVRVSTSPHFEPIVRRLGFDFAPVGTLADFDAVTNNADLWHPTRSLNVLFAREMFSRGLRENYSHIKQWHRPGETVVVGGTLALGSRIAHDALGVPLATVHLQPMGLPSVTEPPRFPRMSPDAWWPRWLVRSFYFVGERFVIDPMIAPPVNALRREEGLPPLSRIWGPWRHSPLCILGLFPDWLGRARDWPAHFHCTGFVRYDQAEVPLSPALEAFLNAGEPPVVISIGSAMRTGRRYFEAALQACVMLNQRALLLARSGDQIPESLPPNAHHEPYAAFSQVFPRCRAVIHHGGIGTAAQALAAGVPHLVMPLSFDQFDTAERLKKLGVARSVPAKKFTTNAARTALDSLLNDTTASSKCKELKLKMQADALPSALIHLESLIGRDTSPSLKPSSKT